MASFSPLDSFNGRGTGMTPTGIVIDKACRVYITQIPLDRIERDGPNALKAEFEVYGPLESYKMFTDRSGRFMGSSLCTYCNPADAAMAVYCMDGVEVEGSTLKVEPAKEHGVVLLASGGGGGGAGSTGEHKKETSHLGFLRDTRRQSARSGWQSWGRGQGSPDSGSPSHPFHTGSSSGDGIQSTGASTEPYGAIGRAEEDQVRVRGPRPASVDDKWSHDKYEMLAEGKDMDEVLGLRRPSRGSFRGRGGPGRGGRRVERVDQAFERYLLSRDLTTEGLAHPPVQGAVIESSESAPARVDASAPVAVEVPMAELAFGEDISPSPVTGAELGALPEE